MYPIFKKTDSCEGKNTGSGHYVCHGLKVVEGSEKWVIFNDAAVALSEAPPLEHAYLYLYEHA
jgi:ubiquitin carboxyl-terminal hydrolase 5/13